MKSQIGLGAELPCRLNDLNAIPAGRPAPRLDGEVTQDPTNDASCFRLARLLKRFTVGLAPEPGDGMTGGIAKSVNPVVADAFRFPKKFSQRNPNLTEEMVGNP